MSDAALIHKLFSLSNRWPCRVVIQTREYFSGEHAFHGEKYARLGQLCGDPARAKQLLEYAALFLGDAWTVDEAHAAGSRRVFSLTREERNCWGEFVADVQTDICQWKALHYREVQTDLFLSGNKPILHLNKPNRRGGVIDGNLLGYIWMDVRADRMAAIEWADERYAN